MERNTIIGMVVAMITVIAVLAVVTVPMISEFSENIHSLESNPDAGYDLVETHKSVEIELVNGVGYINGDPIRTDYNLAMVMFTDSFLAINVLDSAGTTQEIRILESDGTYSTITNLYLDDGTYTGTTTAGETISGEYSMCMRWKEGGSYTRVAITSNTPAYYLDADKDVYVVWTQSETRGGVSTGPIDNQEIIFSLGEAPEYTITQSSYTENPDVEMITGVTSGYTLFVPVKYSVITSADEMVKMMVNITPVLLGLLMFIGIGIYLVNSTKI